MEKNFKMTKSVDAREMQKDTKKQVNKIVPETLKNEIRIGKDMKSFQDSKTSSKIKKFFEQKSGKIQ